MIESITTPRYIYTYLL